MKSFVAWWHGRPRVAIWLKWHCPTYGVWVWLWSWAARRVDRWHDGYPRKERA